MDPRRFDDVARRLAHMLSRRTVVGASLGASLLVALGFGEAAFGKNTRNQNKSNGNGGSDRKGRDRPDQKNGHKNDTRKDKSNDGDKKDGKRGNAHGDRSKGAQSDKKSQNRSADHNDRDTSATAREVEAEGCLRNGKRCGSGKKLRSCSACCSGFNITTRSKKKKCACKPDGHGCKNRSQCCAGVCDQDVCGALS